MFILTLYINTCYRIVPKNWIIFQDERLMNMPIKPVINTHNFLWRDVTFNLPPASRTRYFDFSWKHMIFLAADPFILSNGRFLQNMDAASGSRARHRFRSRMPA